MGAANVPLSPGYEQEMRRQKAMYEEMVADKARLRKIAKEKEKKDRMETSLVAPGEITDAADSTDLLAQLSELNGEKILSRKEKAWKKKRVSEEKAKTLLGYSKKASNYYNKVWKDCDKTGGHSWRTIDYEGYSVEVCECCSVGNHMKTDFNGIQTSEARKAQSYNTEMIRILQRRMMDVDREAGLLVDPTEDDFVYKPSEQKVPKQQKKIKYVGLRWYFMPWIKEKIVYV